jgi:alkylation response protein AidB-like acyl-CoA dehydrogenase
MEISRLTPRQRWIADMAADLARRFAARADDHDRAGTFPTENYTDLRDAGYLRLVVPHEFGGEGMNLFEMVLAQEQLARGDGATAMAVDMTIHLIGRIAETRQWPESIFARICSEIVERGILINAAATEPDMGSPSRGGVPATSAVPDGDGWRINGHKQFVSMAPVLDYVVVSVNFPYSEGFPAGGVANALIRTDAPGLRFIDTWSDALSLRSSGSNDLILEDVWIDDAWLIDRRMVGAPMPAQTAKLAWFALTLAAVYLGIGQAACDAASTYARERTPAALGRPIASLPNVQQRIGEMQTQLSAARAFLYETARAWSEQPDRRNDLAAPIAMAKYLCTNAAVAVSDRALRVAGGFGLTRRLPLERYYRDARAGLTHAPDDDQALEMVGRAVLGL